MSQKTRPSLYSNTHTISVSPTISFTPKSHPPLFLRSAKMVSEHRVSLSAERWSFLIIALFAYGGLPTLVPAQPQTFPCQSETETAYHAYLNQQYDRAVSLAFTCVEQTGVPDEDLIQAYRIMGLSFVRQDALVEARWAIARMLSIDPAYTVDPVKDPPAYALLVSIVRHDLAAKSTSTQAGNNATPPDTSTREASVLLSDSRPARIDKEATTETPARVDHNTSKKELLRTSGVRLSFRDQGYEVVSGVNLTVWRPPVASSRGRVTGVALGVPTTGTSHLTGIGIGLLGVTGSHALRGLAVAGLGVTAARLDGLTITGLGLYVDDYQRGISINGGLTGGSGSLYGLSVSGIGPSVGGSVNGLHVAGVGVRAKQGIAGITMSTIGIISAANVSGITVSGGLIHAAERLRGGQAAGGLIIASKIQGLTLAPVVMQQSGTGLIVAPGYLSSGRNGTLTGVSLSLVNHVRGRQRGLTIGLFNFARSLQGIQVGLLNYAGNNPPLLRVLPGLNFKF